MHGRGGFVRFRGAEPVARGAIAGMRKLTRLASLAVATLLLAAGSGATASAQQHGHKVPAVSQNPAAGICSDDAHARYVEVDLTPDVPSPRCWAVHPAQRLRVHNPTTSPVRLRWRPYGVTVIAPRSTVTFGAPFASYLEPGDHVARVSMYAGGGFEVDLLSHRHIQPLPAGG